MRKINIRIENHYSFHSVEKCLKTLIMNEYIDNICVIPNVIEPIHTSFEYSEYPVTDNY